MSARTCYNDASQPDPIIGLLLADTMVSSVWERIEEAITVKETVKKIPEYNANVSVEYALCCANMRGLTSDPRMDECFIVQDEEPVSDTIY